MHRICLYLIAKALLFGFWHKKEGAYLKKDVKRVTGFDENHKMKPRSGKNAQNEISLLNSRLSLSDIRVKISSPYYRNYSKRPVISEPKQILDVTSRLLSGILCKQYTVRIFTYFSSDVIDLLFFFT